MLQRSNSNSSKSLAMNLLMSRTKAMERNPYQSSALDQCRRAAGIPAVFSLDRERKAGSPAAQRGRAQRWEREVSRRMRRTMPALAAVPPPPGRGRARALPSARAGAAAAPRLLRSCSGAHNAGATRSWDDCQKNKGSGLLGCIERVFLITLASQSNPNLLEFMYGGL